MAAERAARDRLIRVVLTGSESTGKTTLAARLAAHYRAELVPEFVRDYAAVKRAPIDFKDHGPIARGQMALEDRHAARAKEMIVQDTDLLSTVVYCDHYFEKCPPWIRSTAYDRRPDLYLLMDIDTPWVADGVRDRGHLRAEMQQLFRTEVERSGVPFTVISGSGDARFYQAVKAIDGLLSARGER